MSASPDHNKPSAAVIERMEICAKYDRGREDGAKIDPWEDPKWEVYQKTDRYGFIHDKPLPDEKESRHRKLLETELRRVDKWVKMLINWDKLKINETQKFRDRIYKGVPNKVRSEVWKKLLGIEEIKKSQQGVYKRMKEEARLRSPEIRQIDLDVNRTFRNHEMFRRRYDIKQQMLFHVLAAYSMYNTEVGYCQGMSQVAALLLMYMDDEDAFWGISALLSDRRYAMHGFFIPGFPKLMRFQTQHEQILDRFLPKVRKHLEKHDVHTNLYSVKWFFQCFVDRVPFHLCLRLWDIYLFEGERLLSAMAYTIFKMHRPRILKMKSMEGIVDLLQRDLEKDFGFSDDDVIEKLKESMEELRKARLDVPAPENELPSKPFGLMYNPTVAQVRRMNDTSALTGRISQLSTSDDKQLNGHTKSSVVFTDPPSSKSSNSRSDERVYSPSKVSASRLEDRLSPNRNPSPMRVPSPKRLQLSADMASVYDNVEYTTSMRPNQVHPERWGSPASPTSPEKTIGDHKYVSYIEVNAGESRVPRMNTVTVEKSEMTTREYVVGLRSPERVPGLQEITAAKGALRSPQREMGMNRDGSRSPSSPEVQSNGGKTVIRIG